MKSKSFINNNNFLIVIYVEYYAAITTIHVNLIINSHNFANGFAVIAAKPN